MKISVIGTGTMGFALADRMLFSGFDVTAWNRSSSKADPLVTKGAALAATPSEAVSGAQIVLSSLKDDAALREVLLPLPGHMPADAVLCDTSTISPGLAEELASTYAAAGRMFVHAPVLGSKRQIAEGSLLVFASGSQQAVDVLDPVLGVLARRVWRFDEPGRVAALKLACNMMIAGMICALSQSLAYGAKLGVDPELFLDVIQSSNLASPMYQSKGRQILDRNWAANFFVDNIVKDITLALDSAEEAGVQMPVIAVIRQMFAAASASGFGHEDYSAVSKVFEEIAGITPG